MITPQIEIQLIASLVAIACAIPGTFLVLRKMALISDAISHSILPGLVIGFFISHDVNSPILIMLGTIFGVFTVVLVEYIQKTKLVKEDTAIGLVFPALFSIGVIMIAKNANDIHLDVDAVLLGELAFTPFDRLLISGMDFGPKSLWVIGIVLLVTLTLLFTFFKELKISTFDSGLASALGFSPIIIHYGLMTVSSITTVVAFDAVGSILVVALMIAPAASAYMLTNNLKRMLILAVCFGVFSAISGYWLAHFLVASIAGSMITMLGVVFLIIFLFSPTRGILVVFFRNRKQKAEVLLVTLLLQINNSNIKKHEINYLSNEISWRKTNINSIIELAVSNKFIVVEGTRLVLTENGKTFIDKAIHYIISNDNTGLEESMKTDFFLFKG